MKEILFRGKRLDNNKWIQGYYVKCESDSLSYIIPNTNIYDGYSVVIDETVGQFTGLYDKNNVRIFESDIISIKNEEGEIYRFEVKFGKCGGIENVKHDVGYVSFYFWRNYLGFSLRTDPIYWLNAYDCEVIGNIYDNPELLKEKATS